LRQQAECDIVIAIQLARALQALRDPSLRVYVSVYVCRTVGLSATMMLNISETKRLKGSCPIGSL